MTSIDHVHEAVVTFWAFHVDGEFSTYGIDHYSAAEGDVVGFDYQPWILPPA